MKIIITGATGLVGEGVLMVCLENPEITEVLTISRKPSGRQHNKLKELIVNDFSEIKNKGPQLSRYDACFFCAGVSSVGETEESFTKKTYDFVISFAEILSQTNPAMTFIYVSGNRTDSTEQGKVMWARVKRRTENALLKLPFKAVYNFRPGFMKPMKGQKNVRFIYRIFDALSPVWYLCIPNWICRMEEVGLAMIHCTSRGYNKTVLEVKDIKASAL
ncbi:NAD-dependent epimerase/dehydratase family protein [Chryseobacterium rhizosphaerae]|uniref:NAD-dependent epimerase/dehydratase family protein n=1 Tax=Chryseobacterium rhizosphaerae TaxID=395937 RepID=UPI00235880D0|nr:NAD-dependent epimerase/dehydratase family protein [Chryseobacterium rhizosphaerae]MDC8099764.1 NAD-dependent epimerase/dehydratase family protein [Chryseobacterium rhizosphaerae]